MLRYQADRKTVLWMAATTVLLIAQWRFGRVPGALGAVRAVRVLVGSRRGDRALDLFTEK
jgi:hypothetical protein